MIQLYGGQFSRASIVHWYLEELQLPYEFIRLDMQAGEHRQPEFLAINPFGKVPAIVDGDVKLFESGAILMYLADKAGALRAAAARLRASETAILAANAQDMEAAKAQGLSAAMLDRLRLDHERLAGVANAVDQVAVLSDPVGQITFGRRAQADADPGAEAEGPAV
ncbi:MAG: hypothetical protein RLZZ511_2088, partial [Cyanobacteriota bacterium]